MAVHQQVASCTGQTKHTSWVEAAMLSMRANDMHMYVVCMRSWVGVCRCASSTSMPRSVTW